MKKQTNFIYKITPALLYCLFLCIVPLKLSGQSFYLTGQQNYLPDQTIDVYVHIKQYGKIMPAYNMQYTVYKINPSDSLVVKQVLLEKEQSKIEEVLNKVECIYSGADKLIYVDGRTPQPMRLDKLKTGFYLVEVIIQDETGYIPVFVSDKRLVTIKKENEILAYVLNTQTVKIEKGYKWKLLQGMKNMSLQESEGIVYIRPENSELSGYYPGQNLVAAFQNDELLVSENYFNFYQNIHENVYFHLFTDRPAYRPGQWVYFKGISRILRSGNQRDYELKKDTVNYYIIDSKGQRIKTGRVKPDEFGAFADSIFIEPDAVLGEYRIDLYHGNSRKLTESFLVEEYKKTEFEVNIRLDKNKYNMGDSVEVKIKADYFFGAPVKNAVVNYRIMKVPIYKPWWHRHNDYYHWYYTNKSTQNYYQRSKIEKTGEGKTDSTGTLKVKFLTYAENAANYNIFEYTVIADVRDESRRVVNGQTSFNVMQSDFRINIINRKNYFKANETGTIQINCVDANDNKIAKQLKVSIYKEPEDKQGRKEKDRLIQSRNIQTDTSITSNAFIRFKVKEDGSYYFLVEGMNDKGKKVSAKKNFIVYDKGNRNSKFWRSRMGESALLFPNQDLYETDETIEALVYVPNGFDAFVFVDNRGIKDIKKFKPSKSSISIPASTHLVNKTELGAFYNYRFDLSETDMFGPVQLVLVYHEKWSKDGVPKTMMIDKTITVIPKFRFLDVSINFDEQEYRPGQTATAIIRVKDKAGNIIPNAQVSLSTADESIYSLYPDQTKDIRQVFYGPQKMKRNYGFKLLSNRNDRTITSKKTRDIDRSWRTENCMSNFMRNKYLSNADTHYQTNDEFKTWKTRTGILYGFVIDKATQKPLAQAKVHIGNKTFLSNESGFYAIKGFVADKIDVRYQYGEYETTLKNVLIQDDKDIAINIELGKDVPVTFDVNEYSEPALLRYYQDIEIDFNKPEHFLSVAQIDLFPYLKKLENAKDYPLMSMPIDNETGDIQNIIKGKVLSGFMKAEDSVVVYLYEGEEMIDSCLTNSRGMFYLPALAGKSYRLKADKRGYVIAEQIINTHRVSGSEIVTKLFIEKIHLKDDPQPEDMEGCIILGRIYDEDTGTGVAGSIAKLRNSKTMEEEIYVTGSGGIYEFLLEAESNYVLYFTKENYFTTSKPISTIGIDCNSHLLTSLDLDVALTPQPNVDMSPSRAIMNNSPAPSPPMAPTYVPFNQPVIIPDNGLNSMANPAVFQKAKMRTDFQDAIYWNPNIITDSKGEASVKIKLPDNLTTWRTKATVITKDMKVGQSIAKTIVTKDLLVRMETPRFFRQGDELLIATNIHNYLQNDKQAKVKLNVNGLDMEGTEQVITVPANGEKRIDWKVNAKWLYDRQTKLSVKALTDEESDAMEVEVPIQASGLEIMRAQSISLNDDDKKSIHFELPDDIDPGTVSLEVSLSNSITSAMLSAMDDLIAYPYGCVEQTMSRFLPLVVVAETLEDIQGTAHSFDIEKDTLNKMVAAGLKRLKKFQNDDGGWGWWRRNEQSHPYLTAYVCNGLYRCKQAGFDIEGKMYEQAIKCLETHIKDNFYDNPTTRAYQMSVAMHCGLKGLWKLEEEKGIFEEGKTNPYRQALWLQAATLAKDNLLVKHLQKSLEKNLVKKGPFHFWKSKGSRYRWNGDGVETTANVIYALSMSDPTHPLIDRAVQWLMYKRKGSSWHNTRQTAIVIYCLNNIIKQEKDLDLSYELLVNGEKVLQKQVDKKDAFIKGESLNLKAEYFLAGILDKDEDLLSMEDKKQAVLLAGNNVIELRQKGSGNTYLNAKLKYFINQEQLKEQDTLQQYFTIERTYYKLTSVQQGDGTYILEKQEIDENTHIYPGDDILVVAKVQSPEQQEFVLIEDPIPGGCEFVRNTSGYIIKNESEYRGQNVYERGNNYNNRTWNNWYTHKELRDDKFALAITQLRRGNYRYSYLLKAQIPGQFKVNPAIIQLMYYPEIRGVSSFEEMKIVKE